MEESLGSSKRYILIFEEYDVLFEKIDTKPSAPIIPFPAYKILINFLDISNYTFI